MPMRVIPDQNQPSAAIEIPLEKPLPDYDLEELEKATPRDVDGILVTQGFRDLVDDARGILTELIAAPPAERRDRKSTRLNSSHGYISYAVFCLKKKTQAYTSSDVL